MSEQHIVAVFLDDTMVVDAAGPFRSLAKAEKVCEKLNKQAEWSEADGSTTLIAQVVTLRPVAELMEELSEDR